jgi:hypothetical protein
MKARTYFDALGRSAQAKGQTLPPPPQSWPQFAKTAYLTGYMRNMSRKHINPNINTNCGQGVFPKPVGRVQYW